MERRDGCPIKDDLINNALRAIEGKWKGACHVFV